jgi:hypothetical protein
MKNPYRSLEHRPLRTLNAATLLLLVLIKLMPAMFLYFGGSVNPGAHHQLTLVALTLAITCVLDMGTLYSLTLGFNGLLDRPWFVLLSPVVNALLATGVVFFFGIQTFLGVSGEMPWWVGPLRVSLVSAVLLAEVAGALILYVRLRSTRPF